MRLRTPFFMLILTVLVNYTLSFGQESSYRLQSDRIGTGGVSFEMWKAGDDQITQFAVPLMFIYPYNDKLRFYATTSPAFCNMTTGVDYSLGGLSDLKLGGHYLILDDQYLVTFGMNLPTGKSGLEADEYPVASTLTMPAFNFRVPNLGQGLDVQAGLSTAREMGDFILGAGITYLMKGGFTPFVDYDESYNPGDEISLMVGADRVLNLFDKEVRMTGDILYSIYFNDTYGGEKVFRSGNRLILQMMSTFSLNSLDMVVFIREAMKGKNKTGAEDVFDTERKNSNANQFEIHGYGYYPYSRNVRLKGALEIKLYSNNDYGRGGATLFGLGGGGKIRLSDRMVFDGDVRLYFGSIQSSAERTGTFGLKLFGGIEYTL